MSELGYESELRQGIADAVKKLTQIEGFVLYGLNIWTDPEAGVSEISADSRENSERVVRAMQEWQQSMTRKLQMLGRATQPKALTRPYSRNWNPAEFAIKGLVRIEHSNWDQVIAGRHGWDVVEPILLRLRDEVAVEVMGKLATDPDAEISIGTRRDWYDEPRPLHESRAQ